MSDHEELLRLRDTVEDVLGFGFENDRLAQLGTTVGVRIQQLGLNAVAEYLAHLSSPENRRLEAPLLAELITVTETFFYRNPNQIEAFVDITRGLAARRGRQVRVLSAGCASGEEPYTLAIALREGLPDFAEWNVEIIALDVNPAMLRKAKRAVYGAWALRAIPAPIRSRYFQSKGKEFVLSEEIQRAVTFRSGNLSQEDPWVPDSFQADVIFCRNVLMYFSPKMMSRARERLTDLLAPNGYLFLGHAETLRGHDQGYSLRHTHDTFYYQKALNSSSSEGRKSKRIEDGPQGALPEIIGESDSWFKTIQAATSRIAALTAPESKNAASALGQSRGELKPRELDDILASIQQEQFSTALDLLHALPRPIRVRPDTLLLEAVLLTNQGRINEAEDVCETLLREDHSNAGAHYLKALCREHAGDITGAAAQDRISAQLDPTFAMPRLHAGIMAKRLKDHPLARRELNLALVLLEREQSSRLVLFGGGFSRETLTNLCSRELSQLKGQS